MKAHSSFTSQIRLSMLTVAIFAILVVSGCDPLASPTYRGEALAVFNGDVYADEGVPPLPPANVTILWLPSREELSGPRPSNRVVVEGTFPASFSLEVHQPPPESAILGEEWTANRGMAWGYIVAIDARATDVIERSDLLGLVFSHAVVYISPTADLSEIQATFVDVNGELKVGYNLISIEETFEEATAVAQCQEQAIEEWDLVACIEACGDDEECTARCDAGPEESEAFERCVDILERFPGSDAPLRLRVNPEEVQAQTDWSDFFPG